MLFPAQISDDSPWKQETATSRLDPEAENRTQEAIDLYFSQHHKVTSPEDMPRNMAANDRSMIEESGSPNLSKSRRSLTTTMNVSKDAGETRACSRWTQTTVTLPPVLPDEVEAVLARYATFTGGQSHGSPVQALPVVKQQSSSGRSFSRIPSRSEKDQGNLSQTSLRRKLFDEQMDQDASDKENDNDDIGPIIDISPGAVMLTPKANGPAAGSPGHGLTWSVSPVARKQKLGPPQESSTPTKD